MAKQEQLEILKQGVEVWNRWREENISIKPDSNDADLPAMDLRGINLSNTYLVNANLGQTDFRDANLSESKLRNVNLFEANLTNANLVKADLDGASLLLAVLNEANLSEALLTGCHLSATRLRNAKLCGTYLTGSNIDRADLTGADLTNAKLMSTVIIKANMRNTSLRGCQVHGIAVWGAQLDGSDQRDLVITELDEPKITVDNLEKALFIYLLLNNTKIRDLIDSITSKVVLILGRFSPERKIVLDALREKLRNRNYLPVVFDFDRPRSRDLTETISTLAHMARFVIADITNARSIPQELQAIVPNLPSVPVLPILSSIDEEYGVFEHFRRYPWVLETRRYIEGEFEKLIESLDEQVINPAEKKANELQAYYRKP